MHRSLKKKNIKESGLQLYIKVCIFSPLLSKTLLDKYFINKLPHTAVDITVWVVSHKKILSISLFPCVS